VTSRRLVAALGGISIGVLVGGWLGVLVGVLVVGLLHRRLSRLPSTRVRRERDAAARDLPYAADLLAAALRSGLPTDRAVRAVAEALGGPVGGCLARVAGALDLGLPPARAWTAVHDLPAGSRLAATVARSADSGAALAGGLTQLADELRAARLATAEVAAQRAGVLLVLPLGLCFLPAFLVAGVVPVIVAVLGDVLR
jgi:pilus assembly protein TadC